MMDKYARLMQKLDIVNVELFKVSCHSTSVGLYVVTAGQRSLLNIFCTCSAKFSGYLPTIWHLLSLRIRDIWAPRQESKRQAFTRSSIM